MIDIENIVVNTVSEAVWAVFPDTSISSDYDPTPSKFPAIHVYEASNTSYDSFDDENVDHHVNVMYVVDVFALTKSQAKQIRKLTDEAMMGMKFTREYSAPTLNVDRTIKRYTSRYTAVVGELTDNTYQMYRS